MRISHKFDKEALRKYRENPKSLMSFGQKLQKSDDRQDLKYLIPFQKIEIIYQHAIHNPSVREISNGLDLNYSTVLSVIKAYKDSGRIFKLLPHHSKAFILKYRSQNMESQKLYRQFRASIQERARKIELGIDANEMPEYRWIDNPGQNPSTM